MKAVSFFICNLLIAVTFPLSVFAQADTESFKISVFGGLDTESPTTPTLISAIAPTDSQVDLVWSQATDNVFVAGYSIIRDSVPIASTSLLGFSDTGLLASTSYTYEVRAFDAAFNYSSTSNSITVTTPDFVPEEIATSSGTTGPSGTVARTVLRDWSIVAGVSTTSMELTTAHPARIEIRWGRSASYELGYVVSNVFARDHTFLITDLEPGTTYEYEVVGFMPAGIPTVLKTGVFTTHTLNIPILPTNVSRFTATVYDADVLLQWQLPRDESFSHVRIVRSHLRFPEYPQDGAIVYQGAGTSYVDTNILSHYSPMYYTAFVYDKDGTVSSGAVAMAYLPTEGSGGDYPNAPSLEPPQVTPEATSSVAIDRVTVDMRIPDATDIKITQSDRIATLDQAPITLSGNAPLTISIPKKAVAGNLKSIIVTVLDPSNHRQSYAYLLRINKNQTAYEAVLPAFGVAGLSQVQVAIYDYEAFIVARYATPLVIEVATAPASETGEVVFPDVLFKYAPLLGVALAILVVPLFLFFLIRRRREEDEDNH